MSFGGTLIALRESHDISRKLLADKLGIPYTTLRNYETNQREPGYQLLIQIAQMFSVTVDSLIGAQIPLPAKNAPPLSDEALQLARDYGELDQPGKNVVKLVLAEEGKRVQAEKERRQVAAVELQATRYIPLYYTPAAAGMTSPAVGQDYDLVEVGKSVPWNADFAVKIDGESMEPYIRDGSTVYVNREPLENGDVGIFYVDGDMVCKQYYKDDAGNVRLLSLNRAYAHADRFLHARDTDTVMMYYGRVILPRRPIVSWA